MKPFDIATDVTLECPKCRAYKTVPRPTDIPAEVRLIEIICPDCDDGDRHAETWYSAPGVEVSQDRATMTAARQPPSVDPDCVELARKFLMDVAVFVTDEKAAADLASLSEAIQAAVEDWFFSKEQP